MPDLASLLLVAAAFLGLYFLYRRVTASEVQLKNRVATLAAIVERPAQERRDWKTAIVAGEHYLGQVQLFPYTFAPKNWVFCEGQELPINENQALFSFLSTTYGGDGRVTFGLPDLRGKAPVSNLRYCIAVAGSFPSPN